MAHIPDGFLSGPVLLGSAALSAGALGVATRRCRDRLREDQAPLLGAVTAFVFAGQMLNFPLGAGTSAHLLGGVLVGVMVGPWVGMLVLFSVVLIQALLFQDGGIASMGANTLNLAVLGVGGGWLVYRWLYVILGGARRRVLVAGVAAYVTSALIGAALAVELALSGTVPLASALAAVGGGYLVVGIAEAVLTVGILRMVLRSQPHLVDPTPDPSPTSRWATMSLTAAAFALASGALAASTRPDAFEAAAGRLGLTFSPETGFVSVQDLLVQVGAPWAEGAAGVTVAFAFAVLVFRLVSRRRDTT